MEKMITAVLADDVSGIETLLRAHADATTRTLTAARMCEEIAHWLYPGDTLLHAAAAGHRAEIVKLLLARGADPNAAANMRASTPLHYAADGYPSHPTWNDTRQVETIEHLLNAGASVKARDKNGATPLHRAVRTRCAAAVRRLLQAGSDPAARNRSGSTPFHLAVQNTGRGGTGATEAKSAQADILKAFLGFNVDPGLRNGKGQSVLDCVRSQWIRDLLSGKVA